MSTNNIVRSRLSPREMMASADLVEASWRAIRGSM